MKRNIIVQFLFAILFSYTLEAQNAPLTTAPVITACPGATISVPVTVTAFSGIGSISLTLNYDPSVLTFISASNTSGFQILAISGNTAGKIVAAGFNSSSSGVTYPDNTVLFTVTFTYQGGTSALTWYDFGNTCEYTGPAPDYNTLNDLPYGSYYFNGQVKPVLDVDFTAGTVTPEVNQVVQLTDLTTGGAVSWSWTVSPASYSFANGSTATSQNPFVKFTSNGVYTVTLAATKNSCTVTRIKNDFIHCGTPGLWTGSNTSEWSNSKNWHNYLVPESSVDVVIPSSAANWPVYSGDMTLGVQCRSLKIQGSASRMTITGQLIIPQAK